MTGETEIGRAYQKLIRQVALLEYAMTGKEAVLETDSEESIHHPEAFETLRTAILCIRLNKIFEWTCRCGRRHVNVYPGFKCIYCGRIFNPIGADPGSFSIQTAIIDRQRGEA